MREDSVNFVPPTLVRRAALALVHAPLNSKTKDPEKRTKRKMPKQNTDNAFSSSSYRTDEVINVLLVTPSEDDREWLKQICDQLNWELHTAESCQEAMSILRRRNVPVIICEHRLPDGDWKVLLDAIARFRSQSNLIVCSRFADNRLWAEVLNLGGYDLLATPFRADEVSRVAFLAWDASMRALCKRPDAVSATGNASV
jgi:response regulator RpfG family c-di-GMP phosphodiesterase